MEVGLGSGWGRVEVEVRSKEGGGSAWGKRLAYWRDPFVESCTSELLMLMGNDRDLSENLNLIFLKF